MKLTNLFNKITFFKNPNFLLAFFCFIILGFVLRGIPGNPTAKDLSSDVWVDEKGPLELSPEKGRYALTYSLVENKSIYFSKELARFSAPDVGYINNRYVSLFAPSLSAIAIPGYILGKFFGSAQLGTYLTVTIFAVLNALLIRLIAIRIGVGKKAAIISSFAFIFASPAFSYAVSFYQHHLSTFLILLSIYILTCSKSVRSLAAIWFLFAFAVTVDYPNFFMMLPIALTAFFRSINVRNKLDQISLQVNYKKLLTFIVAFVPLISLLLFNQFSNGNPFLLSGGVERAIGVEKDGTPKLEGDVILERLDLKPGEALPEKTILGFFQNRNMLNGIYIQLFSLDRGFIVYAPVMLFGILGLIYALRKKISNSELLLSIVGFNLILYSMWSDPAGGWAFGTRYLIPSFAILSIFIGFALRIIRKNIVLLLIFMSLFSYSIGVNTIGAVTSNRNPPRVEINDLESKTKKVEKYTFMRNFEKLNDGNVKSYFYQTNAKAIISAKTYYLIILLILLSSTCFILYQFQRKDDEISEVKNNESESLTNYSEIDISQKFVQKVKNFFHKRTIKVIVVSFSTVSIVAFIIYYLNGLGLAYNDARSHLDIGRRVVENLQPGFAQLGSVWLPLPHLLMTVTIWNDFMWHSGLSGAIQSMVSYVACNVMIYLFLKKLNVSMFGRVIGVLIFAFNLNVLYMQSTAMTELLLLATLLAGTYQLLLWFESDEVWDLIKSAFFVMLATLIRYEGWFLLLFSAILIFLKTLKKSSYKRAEGMFLLYSSFAGLGVVLWVLWNTMIFKDPLYFIFGPYSASAQQELLEEAGVLATKHDLFFSLKTYYFALVYNTGMFQVILGVVGALFLFFDKRISKNLKMASTALFAPFIFNVLALYLGHSVLFVQGLSGTSWFNVRYGLMMAPAIAIFIGFFMDRVKSVRLTIIGMLLFVTFFTFVNHDAVTIDDAVVGASGKNVKEVSGYLEENALQEPHFVLISAASHDAIIFSSGLPMKRFIHEGTGLYWDLATAHPEKWARWIILRTYDQGDQTYRILQYSTSFKENYTLVHKFPFADIYELKPEFISALETNASAFE